jgi:hypothetical protein
MARSQERFLPVAEETLGASCLLCHFLNPHLRFVGFVNASKTFPAPDVKASHL